MLKFSRWHWLFSLIAIILLATACSSADSSEDSDAPTGQQAAVATENARATAVARQFNATGGPTATPRIVGNTRTAVDVSAAVATNTPSATHTLVIPPTASPTETTGPASSGEEAEESDTRVAYATLDELPNPHFWLVPPLIGADVKTTAERTYLYGSTRNGELLPHHGLDFQNPTGTMVVAAADGVVVFAGDDFDKQYYGRSQNFYGNFVVLEHNLPIPGTDKVFTLYTLYGHLSRLLVQTGDAVAQYDPIAEVGATGIALGPHLHFEVRLGEANNYGATYNPALWLHPAPGNGVLAGTVLSSTGEPLEDVEVLVYDSNNRLITTTTYILDTQAGQVNGDPRLRENFAIPDLPAGDYTVKVSGTNISRSVTVNASDLSMVYLTLN